MKTLFKSHLFFSCIAVLLCFGIIAPSYGQALVSVDPPEVASPAVDSQLTIHLKITNGQNVAGYEVSVNFDTSALQYVSSVNGNYLPAGAFFAPPKVSQGKITLTATSVSDVATAANGTLASVTFSVLSVKTSTLQLTNVILSDPNATRLSVSTRNGAISGSQETKWDVNQDGTVNVLDLTLVAQNLGSSDTQTDVNGDGTVDVLDLVLVSRHLGESTGGNRQAQTPVQTPPTTAPPIPLEPMNGAIGEDEQTQPTPTPDTSEPVNEQAPPTPTLTNMVLIPAGEFQMGSNDAEASNDEQPVSTVYVNAFYMDETEVTNAHYKAFVTENPEWQKGQIDARFATLAYLNHWNENNYPAGTGDHPVTFVGWQAAMAYAKWAGKRLPTEAEWERAARGGLVGNKYPHGNTITPADANYNKNVSDTTAVKHYPANPYGLYDMAGNVWEWCLDEYDSNFYSTFPQDGVARNPLSGANSVEELLTNFADTESDRVLRSGAWSSLEQLVRVATRSGKSPMDVNEIIGFRCVRAASP